MTASHRVGQSWVMREKRWGEEGEGGGGEITLGFFPTALARMRSAVSTWALAAVLAPISDREIYFLLVRHEWRLMVRTAPVLSDEKFDQKLKKRHFTPYLKSKSHKKTNLVYIYKFLLTLKDFP